MKIITSFETLMVHATELGQAKKSGNKDRILEAQKRHDEYANLCLKSNCMVLGCTKGDLRKQ